MSQITDIIANSQSPLVTAQPELTDNDFPVSTLWIFKASIIMAAISVIAFLIGFWIPYFIILIPLMPIYNYLTRKNFHFTLADKNLVLKQGILSKQQRTLPYGVIQNVFMKQDVFDRIFKLAAISLENAANAGGSLKTKKENSYKSAGELGFKGNKISISGLSLVDAEKLKAAFLQKIKDNPIENTGGL